MQVDVFHRQHLSVSTSGSAALHPKTGTKRRLTQRDSRHFSDFIQSKAKPDGYSGFSNPCFGRSNSCYQYEFAFPYFLFINQTDRNFGNIRTVGNNRFPVNPQLVSYIFYPVEFYFVSYIYV